MTRSRIVTERLVCWESGAIPACDLVLVFAWIHESGWDIRWIGEFQGVAMMRLEREGRVRRRSFPRPGPDAMDDAWRALQRDLVRA